MTAHPVSFEVEYLERRSRLTVLFRLVLAIPQLIVVYLLQSVLYSLTGLAWFSILFTGRYPKGFFDFNAGIMRWTANVLAYAALLRDEYPPFSFERGEYPLTLGLERADRQSRLRLFIRVFALFPNQLVFYLVELAWLATTVVAWFAILITGRYPRRLFQFSVGVMRWYQRQFAYLYLLRDEYPPYGTKAEAKPGNEVLSAIIGLPLFAGFIALQLVPLFVLASGFSDTVMVQSELPSLALASEAPSGEANGVRITLLGYEDDVTRPVNAEHVAGHRFISFRVAAEKDGLLPTFFSPLLLQLRDCGGSLYSPETIGGSSRFRMFWRGGTERATVVFQIPRHDTPCVLYYYSGLGKISFLFREAHPPCADSLFVPCLEAQLGLQSIASDTCDGAGGRVCLVPLGQISVALVEHLVDRYRDDYGLTVIVLTPSPVPEGIVDPVRKQIDAVTMIEYMGTLFPAAYADSEAVLIGMTPVDLYDKESHFRFVFGVKGTSVNPKAIVSTFRMNPKTYILPANDELLFSRARKLVSKYIGLLFYRLPTDSDPRSPLFDNILGLDDLDRMSEPLPIRDVYSTDVIIIGELEGKHSETHIHPSEGTRVETHYDILVGGTWWEAARFRSAYDATLGSCIEVAQKPRTRVVSYIRVVQESLCAP